MSEILKNRTQLPFPLHYYDEEGYLKPAIGVYLCSLWLSKAVLLLIVSVSFRENPGAILEWFYPLATQWYVSVVPALPGICALVLLSFRERLRKKGFVTVNRWVRRVLWLGLVLQIAIGISAIASANGVFHFPVAFSLLLTLMACFYVARSKRLRAFSSEC